MDELAKRFSDLAEKYAPNVVDAALSAARIEGFSQLAAGALCLFITVAMGQAGRWLWAKAVSMIDQDEADFVRTFSCLSFALALLPAALCMWSLMDPWTWTAIFHPELWIAKRALHL